MVLLRACYFSWRFRKTSVLLDRFMIFFYAPPFLVDFVDTVSITSKSFVTRYRVPVEPSSFLKILTVKVTGKERSFNQTILFSPSLSCNVFKFWYRPFFLSFSEKAINRLLLIPNINFFLFHNV
jgi:hypothetical protein